eukprot:107613-Rhodomonas_salina.4
MTVETPNPELTGSRAARPDGQVSSTAVRVPVQRDPYCGYLGLCRTGSTIVLYQPTQCCTDHAVRAVRITHTDHSTNHAVPAVLLLILYNGGQAGMVVKRIKPGQSATAYA